MEVFIIIAGFALLIESVTNYLNARQLDRMEEEMQQMYFKLENMEDICKRTQCKVKEDAVPWGRHIGGM